MEFDIGWFIEVAMSNLLFVFMFFALAVLLFDGKRKILLFVAITAYFWLQLDFMNASGMVIYVAAFVSVLYISRVAIVTFASAEPRLSKHLVTILSVQFWVMAFLFNIFWVS